MSRRLGLVADAAVQVLADTLAQEMPLLPQYDIQRMTERQVEALRRDGWHITAPVSALAKTGTTTRGAAT